MLTVSLMAAAGAMFLGAHMLVPGLALFALAAMLPQIRFTFANFQQMCRQIESTGPQRDSESPHAAEAQPAAPLRSA